MSLGVFYFGRARAYSTPASRAVGSTVGWDPGAYLPRFASPFARAREEHGLGRGDVRRVAAPGREAALLERPREAKGHGPGRLQKDV